jgi:hypothetical protein
MKLPKINWKWVAIWFFVGIFTRSLFLTYFAEHFTAPSSQVRAVNCPDGTRTTTGHCLME